MNYRTVAIAAAVLLVGSWLAGITILIFLTRY